jgi:mRNA interferase RelE/StbE
VTESPWSVELERRAIKDLRRLDPPTRERIVEAIERLADDPGTAELRRLRGRAESRLRVGDWRVIVELNRSSRTIVVCRVLPRGRAYER